MRARQTLVEEIKQRQGWLLGKGSTRGPMKGESAMVGEETCCEFPEVMKKHSTRGQMKRDSARL